MKTIEQIQKIKAVVLYILKQLPQGVDYIHLFKIMYFAQQEHLVIYGLPLLDDTFVSILSMASLTVTSSEYLMLSAVPLT